MASKKPANRRRSGDTSPYGPSYPSNVDRKYEKVAYDVSKGVLQTIYSPITGAKKLGGAISKSKTIPYVAGEVSKTLSAPVRGAASLIGKATKKAEPKKSPTKRSMPKTKRR